MLVASSIFAFAALVAAAPAEAAPASDSAFLGYSPPEGERFNRRFFFHRPGVSLEEARVDVAECQGYADDAMVMPREPDSVPPDPETLPPSINGGLAGGLAFGLVAGGERAKMVAASLRKCMSFKGYDRYGLSEALAKQLNAGTPEEVLLRKARLASGPAPSGRRLDP